jgi:hypothetical protein
MEAADRVWSGLTIIITAANSVEPTQIKPRIILFYFPLPDCNSKPVEPTQKLHNFIHLPLPECKSTPLVHALLCSTRIISVTLLCSTRIISVASNIFSYRSCSSFVVLEDPDHAVPYQFSAYFCGVNR